ncbi:hypothetical protein [Actinoallomurus iriomotensis]|uniref:Uncharacterized protein n=1 Tax=Actinoallomurus iriomotensis TaxID=478107 RepID=A0A9W6W1K1_9ACTN|nr:hypothetical protein [Actinoallomurus iriomotensis]GLY87489.1 hypothetical protein Airi02_054180 [Actinoallomurus iriomotensis]
MADRAEDGLGGTAETIRRLVSLLPPDLRERASAELRAEGLDPGEPAEPPAEPPPAAGLGRSLRDAGTVLECDAVLSAVRRPDWDALADEHRREPFGRSQRRALIAHSDCPDALARALLTPWDSLVAGRLASRRRAVPPWAWRAALTRIGEMRPWFFRRVLTEETVEELILTTPRLDLLVRAVDGYDHNGHRGARAFWECAGRLLRSRLHDDRDGWPAAAAALPSHPGTFTGLLRRIETPSAHDDLPRRLPDAAARTAPSRRPEAPPADADPSHRLGDRPYEPGRPRRLPDGTARTAPSRRPEAPPADADPPPRLGGGRADLRVLAQAPDVVLADVIAGLADPVLEGMYDRDLARLRTREYLTGMVVDRLAAAGVPPRPVFARWTYGAMATPATRAWAHGLNWMLDQVNESRAGYDVTLRRLLAARLPRPGAVTDLAGALHACAGAVEAEALLTAMYGPDGSPPWHGLVLAHHDTPFREPVLCVLAAREGLPEALAEDLPARDLLLLAAHSRAAARVIVTMLHRTSDSRPLLRRVRAEGLLDDGELVRTTRPARALLVYACRPETPGDVIEHCSRLVEAAARAAPEGFWPALWRSLPAFDGSLPELLKAAGE